MNAFIAAARTAVPSLLHRLLVVEGELAEANRKLAAIQAHVDRWLNAPWSEPLLYRDQGVLMMARQVKDMTAPHPDSQPTAEFIAQMAQESPDIRPSVAESVPAAAELVGQWRHDRAVRLGQDDDELVLATGVLIAAALSAVGRAADNTPEADVNA